MEGNELIKKGKEGSMLGKNNNGRRKEGINKQKEEKKEGGKNERKITNTERKGEK